MTASGASPAILEIERVGALTFVRILSGALAIGHRPPRRSMSRMRDAGATHIVTVLSKRENPELIAESARDAGLDWMWIELGSTKNLPARAKPEIDQALQSIGSILAAGGRIYLHCSAGIHRTGMIAAALLFRLGFEESIVRQMLSSLRALTAEGMGAQRFEWARSFSREV